MRPLSALDRCTAMQHLTVLEGADLVIVPREERERWNHLNPLPINTARTAGSWPYAARGPRAAPS